MSTTEAPAPTAERPLSDDAAHLLVIDDDKRIRTLLSRYLGDQGFRSASPPTRPKHANASPASPSIC